MKLLQKIFDFIVWHAKEFKEFMKAMFTDPDGKPSSTRFIIVTSSMAMTFVFLLFAFVIAVCFLFEITIKPDLVPEYMVKAVENMFSTLAMFVGGGLGIAQAGKHKALRKDEPESELFVPEFELDQPDTDRPPENL